MISNKSDKAEDNVGYEADTVALKFDDGKAKADHCGVIDLNLIDNVSFIGTVSNNFLFHICFVVSVYP